jgi:hypothetical protein
VKVVDVFSPGKEISTQSFSPSPHINAVLKALWHALNALIYKVLAYFLPSFVCYFAGFELIPMRKLLEMLLHHLPTVLDRGKVGWIASIEEVTEVVFAFPVGYEVAFTASTVSGILVFFEDEGGVVLELFFDYRFEDIIPIHLEWKLAILVAWDLVIREVALEILANGTPNVGGFPFSFAISVELFLDTIQAITLPRSSNNAKLALRTYSTVYFIWKSNVMPALLVGFQWKHRFAMLNPLRRVLLRNPTLCTCYTFVIINRTKIRTNRISTCTNV